MPNRRALSVRYELAVLRNAIQGARMVVDLVRYQSATDAHDARWAPDACGSILALVESRLQLLDLAMARDVDPKLLIAHHNELNSAAADETAAASTDVLLHAFSNIHRKGRQR